MPALPAPVALDDEPIRFRMRGELDCRSFRRSGKTIWLVKDPLRQEYFELSDQDYFLMKKLDGRSSWQALCGAFSEAHPNLKLDRRRFEYFLRRLHRDQLIVAEAWGQGDQLLGRFQRHRRLTLIQQLANPLAVRFRGFDPNRLLSAVYPRLRWLFTPLALLGMTATVVAAILLIVLRWEECTARLMELKTLGTPQNVVFLALALTASRVLHEWAHALACKHYGGECHEMGLMFLVFTPCLYCDVSDSWMSGNAGKRMVVAGAGIISDIVVGCLGLLIWWCSQPGWLHTFSLDVAIVCGIGTVVFNANPLLRYDGYYILSDMVGVPNLWQRSHRQLGLLCQRGLGLAPSTSHHLQSISMGQAAYAAVSIVYRVLVITSILFLLVAWLRPWSIEWMAYVLAATLVIGWLAPLAAASFRFWSQPSMRNSIRPGRLAVSSAIGLLTIVLLICLPLPARVRTEAFLEYSDAEPVYVQTGGQLTQGLSPGTSVRKGQPIASLKHLPLLLESIQINGELKVREEQIRSLASQLDQPNAHRARDVAEAARQDAQVRLAIIHRQLEQLTPRAPRDGIILPPLQRPLTTERPVSPLRPATPEPLDSKHDNCHLAPGTVLCRVGNPDVCEAILHVDQTQVNQLQIGQRVQLRMNQLATATIEGRIAEIAVQEFHAGRSEVGADANVGGDNQPTFSNATFKVRVQLQPDQSVSSRQSLVEGGRGRAVITIPPQTIATRVYRFLRHTFAIQL